MKGLIEIQPSTSTSRSRDSYRNTPTLTNVKVLGSLKTRLRKRVSQPLSSTEILSSAVASPSVAMVATVTQQPSLRSFLSRSVVSKTWAIVSFVTMVTVVRTM